MTTTVHGLDGIRAQAGADLGRTGWLEIAQPRVDTFADATDDHQWIHVDTERAKAGPFGATIAHGYLTLSLLIPLWTELLQVEGVSMAVNYGLNKVRFPSPVKVGARIRAHGRVASVEDVRGGVEVVADLTVEIEGAGKPACVAQAVYRFLA
ncbi:MaoC family dehydratase [Streptomyces sp. CB01881]|uniref:MaoC family dehydratase n=1 Tax=Streptomyces sp. CB01881 TaxID=2078691 RepID=UPI000CDBCA02|nr:MaoC family dehydratase [Streptomyces sp. CB01881]AUY52973.1 enoyl-CoA hydratase [Streptomyces sp. CB01881]TYC70689.1 MaoC family dehydratase [Streptomyces sp. CB01881]